MEAKQRYCNTTCRKRGTKMKVKLLNKGGFKGMSLKVGKVYEGIRISGNLCEIYDTKRDFNHIFWIGTEVKVIKVNKVKFLKTFLREHKILTRFKLLNKGTPLKELDIDRNILFNILHSNKYALTPNKVYWFELMVMFKRAFDKEYGNGCDL